MIPYLLIFFLLLFATVSRGLKERDILALFAFFGMMLLCGLRGIDVGVDTYNYYYAYIHGSDRFEPMTQILMWLCSFFNLSPKGFLMSMALMTFIPLYLFVKKNSVDISFSFLIFLSFSAYFYHETFNTARVYMAMVFSLFSFSYASEQKFLKSIGFLVISVLCHYSAVVVIPFVYFAKMVANVRLKTMLITILVSIIFGILFVVGFKETADQLSLALAYYASGDLADYYQKHLDRMEETTFNMVGTLSNMLPFSAFAICMYDEKNAQSLYYKLFLTAVVIENLFISVVLSYRVSMFFLILIIILLPNSYNRATGIRKHSLEALTLFMLLWYVYQMIRATDESFAGTIPYSF